MTVYAIHKWTKEHFRFDDLTWTRVANYLGPVLGEFNIVEADADGWIPWSGGECPLPVGARFDVETREGGLLYNETAGDSRVWQHGFGGGDIIEYRPILDEDEEPEEIRWDGGHLGIVTIEAEDSNRTSVCVRDKDGHIHLCPKSLLSPIRSAEDRAIDDMCEIMEDAPHIEGDISDYAVALYRAGYRKEK